MTKTPLIFFPTQCWLVPGHVVLKVTMPDRIQTAPPIGGMFKLISGVPLLSQSLLMMVCPYTVSSLWPLAVLFNW
jgi:hypothetical protein